MKNPITDPKHEKTKIILRISGISFLLIGGILVAIAIADFFAHFNLESGMPKLTFLAFIGIPLLFLGGVLTSLGFMRAANSYVASQSAPVTSDTINYIVDNTSDSVAKATDKINGTKYKICRHCGLENDLDASFCRGCGKPLNKACPKCGNEVSEDDKFCDSCGERLK